jgi:hypothetical protein
MAVLLYISCKQFKKALDILADMNNMNNCELAYNFLNICLKHKLIDDLQLPNNDNESSTTSVQANFMIKKINENYEKYKETNKL